MSQDVFVLIEHNNNQLEEISSTLQSAANQLASIYSSRSVSILLGKKVESLAKELFTDKVLIAEDPVLEIFNQEAYIRILFELISTQQPRILLLGNTTIGSDISNILSVMLDLDLVSSCKSFTAEGNIISQICGGKIMVETEPSSKTTLVTMVPGGYKSEMGENKVPVVEQVSIPGMDNLRIQTMKMIPPESSDIDITKEPVLISVGRGIQTQDNLELAENLANALKGVVCASRPVVDQGWIPTSRLVGKSGKHVKPKLYLALGISGAPEHVEAITNSETIIAINTDPRAPIFDIATYGTETDLFDLIDPLVEKIIAAGKK